MYSFVVLLLLLGQTISAQDSSALIRNYFDNVEENANAKASSDGDFSKWKITDEVPSLKAGIKHVYVQQYHGDIPIIDGTYKFTVKNNKITYEIDQFVKNTKSKIVSAKSSSTEAMAINAVARAHGLAAPGKLSKIVGKSSAGTTVSKYDNSGIAMKGHPIEVSKVYKLHNDELKLCWNVSLYEKSGNNWWNSYVDASNGKIIYEENWVVKCSFGDAHHHNHDHGSVLFDHKKEVTAATATAFAPDSYNVYALPVESPNHGNRSIVTNPANTVASPFGWHDTNGASGAEFTITRGNNVWAQDDRNGNNGTGFSPDGGATLDFDFPINLNLSPDQYLSAAITNLFYWNNIMHDIWYQYGFDEASGNFQENNYGNGGIGSDSVNADAQDGSRTNNATFSTPPDGSNPRMSMFLFTNPTRDGDLDNVIIAHEYGHGISTRLVGGPSANRLGGSEQMGEGWSDWFGLVLTMKPGDVGTTGRGVGTYAIGEPTTGGGIRPTPYSTDRSINNTDYADIGGLRVPHGVGYGFATILWDMTWLLIDQEGFDPDVYNGTGGNNIAMALVIEGLKNTANNPGFVSGRDGILQADQDLYNGQYRCLIWKAFAERGVGEGANENNNGGTNSNNDQVVSFVNPCDGGGPGPGTCSGDVASFPFTESFETNFGEWAQETADDLNWTRNSGGTPSNGTGPSSAFDGSTYVYVEASGNGTGFPNKRAILNSPCLNFSSLTSPSLAFRYHMVGSAIESLTVEARTDNTGSWTSVFSRNGAQGTDWNAANIDLSAYAGETSVQLRFNVLTGDGSQGWQSDIAIDAVSIQNGTGNPDPVCDSIDFNNFQINSFSNQDSAGNFTIQNAGTTLSLQNNTWKSIAFNYTVTTNTVIEFDFSSTSQGEIHGIGFETDNTLTATQYFKVHGTQNYGVTNFDDYTSGSKKYVIPVGTFYTGAMNQLVFINDNDAGSGNTSVFSNVKIYEGSCGGSLLPTALTSFGDVEAIMGDEDEGVLSFVKLTPNPTRDSFVLNIGKNINKKATATIYTILGRKKSQIKLNSGVNTFSAKDLALGTGMYLIRIEVEGEKTKTQKLIIQ